MTKFKKQPSATTSDWGLLLLQDKSSLSTSPPVSSTTSEATNSVCSDKFAYRISLQTPIEQSRLVQILRELLGVEFEQQQQHNGVSHVQPTCKFHEPNNNCQEDDMEIDQETDYSAACIL